MYVGTELLYVRMSGRLQRNSMRDRRKQLRPILARMPQQRHMRQSAVDQLVLVRLPSAVYWLAL